MARDFMEASGENASDEVTLFLDDGDLYVTGEADAIDLVLSEVLGPDDPVGAVLQRGLPTRGRWVPTPRAPEGT